MTTIKARILCDSLNACETRLTTFELTYPRCIHSEFMTHRVFGRNASSSRAIPVQKMIDMVLADPFIPLHWGKNQKGMQAFEVLDETTRASCEALWLDSLYHTVDVVKVLIEKGLHKQIANRLLEPWMHITVIATTSFLSNFFKLRCHKDAEPHFKLLAECMRDEANASCPKFLEPGQWHSPFSPDPEISVARCARGSYLTQHGNFTPHDDKKLFIDLCTSGHWSPFEHQAQSLSPYGDVNSLRGNLGRGWSQHRKMINGG